ncbi:conserved hypothetical protein [Ricinus communis]|uniref:Uncharacterized protein n=1 Tax=Ricinus communis TaxID=3988 RepID=B9S0L5_RICCO|nr:conserved hypothetical protein [Ricinus communis]
MSKEGEAEDNDERKLYQCARKYEKIVKQFNKLIEMMNQRTRPPKRRKLSSRCKESSSDATAPASSSQPDSNEVLVQSITKFLQDLRAKTDADCPTNTRDP